MVAYNRAQKLEPAVRESLIQPDDNDRVSPNLINTVVRVQMQTSVCVGVCVGVGVGWGGGCGGGGAGLKIDHV